MLILWVPSEASFQDVSFLSEGILWGLTSSGDNQLVHQNCNVNMGVHFRDEKTEIQRFEVIYMKVHNQEDPKILNPGLSTLERSFPFYASSQC